MFVVRQNTVSIKNNFYVRRDCKVMFTLSAPPRFFELLLNFWKRNRNSYVKLIINRKLYSSMIGFHNRADILGSDTMGSFVFFCGNQFTVLEDWYNRIGVIALYM